MSDKTGKTFIFDPDKDGAEVPTLTSLLYKKSKAKTATSISSIILKADKRSTGQTQSLALVGVLRQGGWSEPFLSLHNELLQSKALSWACLTPDGLEQGYAPAPYDKKLAALPKDFSPLWNELKGKLASLSHLEAPSYSCWHETFCGCAFPQQKVTLFHLRPNAILVVRSEKEILSKIPKIRALFDQVEIGKGRSAA